jgi:DNA-binding transcriptional ArsR family regulator
VSASTLTVLMASSKILPPVKQARPRTLSENSARSSAVSQTPGTAVSKSARVWLNNLDLLRSHLARTGRWPSETAHDPTEKNLARWVLRQRQAKRSGRLIAERREALDVLSKHFDDRRGRATSLFGSFDEAWWINFDLLGLHLATTGQWPSNAANKPAENKLADWISAQRQAMRKGKLTAERRAALDTLGKHLDGVSGRSVSFFGGTAEAWWITLELLRVHVASTGRWPSSKTENVAERSLGTWVSTQRTAGRNGEFNAERRAALDTLGKHLDGNQRLPTSFFGGGDEAWQNSCDLVGLHVTRTGHWPSPHGKDVTERKLGRWVNGQRQAKRNKKLTVERHAALDMLGKHMDGISFVPVSFFGGANEVWTINFGLFRSFVAATGRWPSSVAKDPTESKLGRWIGTQRQANNKGTLAIERRVKLDALGVDVKGRGWKWSTPSKDLPKPVRLVLVPDDVLKAIAHPLRRQLLMLVRTREMAVKEIAANLDISPQSASVLLKTLSRAGLLNQRREGKSRFFELRPEGLDAVKRVVADLSP